MKKIIGIGSYGVHGQQVPFSIEIEVGTDGKCTGSMIEINNRESKNTCFVVNALKEAERDISVEEVLRRMALSKIKGEISKTKIAFVKTCEKLSGSGGMNILTYELDSEDGITYSGKWIMESSLGGGEFMAPNGDIEIHLLDPFTGS